MANFTGEAFTALVVEFPLGDPSVDAERFGTGGESAPVTYYRQRVWDSGSGGRWCYYEKTTIDPAPAAIDTSPNYTGVISAHSVISVTTS